MSTRLERRLSKEATELQTEIKKINLKDLKDIDDFAFDKVDLVRGQTPDNIKERCLKLCKDYIANDWEGQTVDTINFKRLSGGMTNQLYYIGIAQPSSNSTVPQEVAIRLYGPKHFNNNNNDGNERLTDVIIALMVSENQLGPKIHGIFEDGQIQHFYKHRQFRYPEQNNPVLAEKLFRALARVHAMEVPIKKNTNWCFEFFDDFYLKFVAKNEENKKIIEEMSLKNMAGVNIKAELDWLKKTIIKVNSPVVFTHIDFRGSNIMITEPNDQLVLCDFEYSSYGHRGFDIGTIAAEWGRDMADLTKSEKEIQKFPNDSVLKKLLEYYISESEQIHGHGWSLKKQNSLEQLIIETKVFTLAASMFIIMFCLASDQDQNDIPLDRKMWMQMGDRCVEGYLYMKDKFVKECGFQNQ